MKKLIIVLMLGVLGWQGYAKYQTQQVARASVEEPTEVAGTSTNSSGDAQSAVFKCDGRTRCSQMTSCAEATFFLRNCPGVKMDGDRDGIPCEDQWCR